MPIRCLAILALLFSPITATAQEGSLTRAAELEATAPAATIEDVSWLVGRWEGEGIQGWPAQESYSAPLGGSMAGTFVQLDGEGEVMFYEFIQLAEAHGSLIVRLKHFNADMTGWEEQGEFEAFPLVALDESAAYFDGLTYEMTGPDSLQIAVRVTDDEGGKSELVFPMRRAD